MGRLIEKLQAWWEQVKYQYAMEILADEMDELNSLLRTVCWYQNETARLEKLRVQHGDLIRGYIKSNNKLRKKLKKSKEK